MNRVKLITPIPFSLVSGGLEFQAQKYLAECQQLKVDINFMDTYNSNQPFEILHAVGAAIETARPCMYAKRNGKKVIISPVFFKENSLLLLKYANKFFNILKMVPNSFSLLQTMFNEADLILPNSLSEKEQIIKIFGIDGEKITVLHNGVDVNLFENIKKDEFVKYSNIKTPYLLNVSMIDPRKNTLRLLEAFLSIQTEYKLVIIGGYRSFDTKYNEKVKNLIEKAKDRILHVGLVPPKSPLLLSAYVGAQGHLLPSILETPGLSSLEAGLAGLPILVGECSPVREYFKHYAQYCDPYSISSIAAGIKETIKKSNDSANTSKNSELKTLIANQYTWQKIAEKLTNIYLSI